MTTLDAPPTTTPVVRRTRDRALGLSGLAFAAVLLPVVLVPHAGLDYEPAHPPAASTITAFFHAHRALEQYQAVSHSVAGVLLVLFFAALAARVRAAGSSYASRVTLVGGLGVGLLMVSSMTLVTASTSLMGEVPAHEQLWLYDVGWNAHFKCLYLLPLALVPACVVLRRARMLPAALAWTGLVVGGVAAAAMVAGISSATEFLMYPAFMLLLLWVLATGVVALTRGLAEPTA